MMDGTAFFSDYGRRACMAPGPEWVKSSLSFANGNCVEVKPLPGGTVAVRNSRNQRGPLLEYTRDEWEAFIGGVKNGEFDNFGK
jgi:hypothetical protein